MRRIWLLLACAFGVSGLAGGVAVMREFTSEPVQAKRPSASNQQQADASKASVWQPPSGLKEIPIWPNGAPDMEGVSQPLACAAGELAQGTRYPVIFDQICAAQTTHRRRDRDSEDMNHTSSRKIDRAAPIVAVPAIAIMAAVSLKSLWSLR